MSVAVAQQPVAVPNKKTVAFEPPTTWRAVPLYHLFNSVGGATPSKDNDDYWKGDIPWVSPKDMKASVIFDSIDHISQSALSETRLSLLPVGTVLIVVRGMILAHTIPVATTSTKVTINQDMKGLSAKAGVRPDFLAYLLRAISPLLFSTIEESGHGTRCLRLDLWRNILVGVPLEDEQDRILSFIDRKTAQIDAVVAKKQRLIERLQEKRQALISHAVTKGLDPHAPMKDSGIEWLGQIPAHWKVMKLKHWVSFLNNRRVPISSEDRAILAKEYPYYGASGIIDYVDDYIFDEPLILIGEDGANLLSRSSRLAFIADGKYWVNNHAHILRPKSGCLKFWSERLESISYVPFVTGSAQPKLTIENLANIEFAAPDESEQEKIGEFVDAVNCRIDGPLQRLTQQITKLQEYRQTLISAAVMGKIDVTKAAVC